MRRIVTGLVIVALLPAGGALYAWSRRDRTVASFTTAAPSTVPPALLASLPRTSTLTLPVTVALTDLQRELESRAPRELDGAKDNPVASPSVADDTLRWRFERGAIVLGARDGALAGESRVTGRATLEGKVLRIPFSVSADLGARLRLAARPTLRPDWRVAPGLAITADLDEASVPIGGLARVSIKRFIEPELKVKLIEQQLKLERRIGEDPFLENAARKAWGDLCRSHRLPPVRDLPEGFIEVRPTSIAASQPSIGDTGIRITLNLAAETQVTTAPTAPVCLFPRELVINVAPPAEVGTLTLAVPILVSYDELRGILERKLLGRSFKAAGGFTVTPTSVAIAPDAEGLLLSLGIDVQHGWLAQASSGIVHIKAVPHFDEARQEIGIGKLELAAQSADALDALGLAAATFRTALSERIAAAGHHRLDQELEKHKARIDARLAALAARPPPGLAITSLAQIGRPKLTGLRIGPDAVEITVEVAASATLAVVALVRARP